MVLLSLFLLFLYEDLVKGGDEREGGRGTAIVLLLIFTAFYTVVGSAFTRLVGPHSGDEGHYLIQAESLWLDGDLDIRNNFDPPLDEEDRELSHVSPSSKGTAWYSSHPYGISFLMAPAVPLGAVGRHLVLALISGAGLAGTFLLARMAGAGLVSSLLSVGLLGTSLLWGVYSSRALPEVAGGTLLLLLVLASLGQDRWPRSSVIVASLAATALPFMHTRFLASSLIGVAAFVVLALAKDWRDRDARFRCAWLLLLCALGYGLYAAMQYSHFVGGNPYYQRSSGNPRAWSAKISPPLDFGCWPPQGQEQIGSIPSCRSVGPGIEAGAEDADA
jgi:hypothetical protein